MIYTKKMIGMLLKEELKKGYDTNRIANWAFDLISNPEVKYNREVFNILNFIAIMEMGPEFEYSQKELESGADKMIYGDESPFPHLND